MSKIMLFKRVFIRDYMFFLLRNLMVYIWYENYFRKFINSRFNSRYWFLIEKIKYGNGNIFFIFILR